MKDRVITHLSRFLLVPFAVLLAGCASNSHDSTTGAEPYFQTNGPEQQPDNISFWDGDRLAGRPSIKIDVENQRAYFYKGGQLVGVSVISSGREGHDTPPGKFCVTDKDIDHASSLYGDYVDQSGQVVVQNIENKKDPRPPGTIFRGAPMPYFMRIHGDIGVHAGYLPGYPASHGCIRLPESMAEKFFEYAPIGTPVEIE